MKIKKFLNYQSIESVILSFKILTWFVINDLKNPRMQSLKKSVWYKNSCHKELTILLAKFYYSEKAENSIVRTW